MGRGEGAARNRLNAVESSRPGPGRRGNPSPRPPPSVPNQANQVMRGMLFDVGLDRYRLPSSLFFDFLEPGQNSAKTGCCSEIAASPRGSPGVDQKALVEVRHGLALLPSPQRNGDGSANNRGQREGASATICTTMVSRRPENRCMAGPVRAWGITIPTAAKRV